MMETISGKISDILFANEKNGYAVIRIKCEDRKSVVLNGTVPFANLGEIITATGEWIDHPVYGTQFKIQSYEKKMPENKNDIETFLASGVIKGVGKVLAAKIVEKFGDDTLRVIADESDRLSEIRGITPEKAATICISYKDQFKMKDTMIFFGKNGLGSSYAYKAHKLLGDQCMKIILENPYVLTSPEFGINFRTVDRIAKENGFDAFASARVKAGIVHVLLKASMCGDTYLTGEQIFARTQTLLGIDQELIDSCLGGLTMEDELVKEQTPDGISRVYLRELYTAETESADLLARLGHVEFPDGHKLLKKLSKNLEDGKYIDRQSGIELSDEQFEAVENALRHGVSVITGGPGTGKTTILKYVVELFVKAGAEIVLAAPTGRAAKRMSEASAVEAKTIHRLLEMEFSGGQDEKMVFFRDENNQLDAEVIIIDEMSMVDAVLMHGLLKAIRPGSRLIMVGDVDQLPSVGAGNVLKDIIDSGVFPVTRLTRVYRQAAESMIITNAHRINCGELPLVNVKGKDFFFIRANTVEDVRKTVVDLCKNRLPKNMGFDSGKDIQVISPSRKGETGINILNVELQNALNPKRKDVDEKSYREYIFRVGDRVMQNRNDYNMRWWKEDSITEEAGVFNGDLGVIDGIDSESAQVQVKFDDGRICMYEYANLEELEPAYASTVHKSQGSEFPAVILVVHSGPPILFTRNLLYTAVTRAKKLLVVVGREEALYNMVNNYIENERQSQFADKLRKYFDKYKKITDK